MRNRVIALALVIAAIVFGTALVRHPEVQLGSKSEVKQLFPSDIGSFRIVARRNDETDAYEWTTYRDNRGDTVDLVVNYGLRGPHNSIGCHWSLAQDPAWHQLVVLKTVNSAVVIDVAIFTYTEATPLLIASTECWADKCRESFYGPVGGWIWPWLKILPGKAKSPIPVAIAIKSAVATDGNATLLRVLKSFVGALNLAGVQEFAATR